MSSIIQDFEVILSRQKTMGYGFPQLLNPPATKEQIVKAENTLGFTLNDELIQFYLYANGNKSDGIVTGLHDIIPTYFILSLEDAVEYYKTHIDLEDYFTHSETGYKPGKRLFPFLDNNAGDCYWVNLNENGNGKIYWTNTLAEEPGHKFNSLSEMIQSIREGYDTGVFFVDEEGYLDCDWDRWGEMKKK